MLAGALIILKWAAISAAVLSLLGCIPAAYVWVGIRRHLKQLAAQEKSDLADAQVVSP